MRFIEFLGTKTSLNEMPSVSNKDDIYDIRIDNTYKRNGLYYKIYNANPKTEASSLARITFKQPLMYIKHKNRISLKTGKPYKNWILTVNEFKGLIDILHKPKIMIDKNTSEIINFLNTYDQLIYFFNCRELKLDIHRNILSNINIIEKDKRVTLIKSTSPYRRIPTLSDFKKIIIPKGY